MEKRKLGKSGIEFAPIAFGGNVFGWTADEATSHRLLDAFVDAGFSFIDTADVYSRWVPGHKGGESEAIIGSWLKKNPAKRAKVQIATKCGMVPAEGALKRRPHQEVGRRIAEAPQHRPHRALPVAQGRQGDAAGGDALDLRRAGQGGQARRHRRLQLRRAAARRGGQDLQGEGPAALREPAAALQSDGARPVRGCAGERVPEGGDRRHPVLLAGQRLPERQVPLRGRCRQRPARRRREEVHQPQGHGRAEGARRRGQEAQLQPDPGGAGLADAAEVDHRADRAAPPACSSSRT